MLIAARGASAADSAMRRPMLVAPRGTSHRSRGLVGPARRRRRDLRSSPKLALASAMAGASWPEQGRQCFSDLQEIDRLEKMHVESRLPGELQVGFLPIAGHRDEPHLLET